MQHFTSSTTVCKKNFHSNNYVDEVYITKKNSCKVERFAKNVKSYTITIFFNGKMFIYFYFIFFCHVSEQRK